MGISHHTLDMYKLKFKGSGFYPAMVPHRTGYPGGPGGAGGAGGVGGGGGVWW